MVSEKQFNNGSMVQTTLGGLFVHGVVKRKTTVGAYEILATVSGVEEPLTLHCSADNLENLDTQLTLF